MRQVKGFTLLELMIVIAILGLVMAIAIPNISDYMDKRRVISAAESIYSQIVYARSEAISRSTEVAVVVKDDTTPWALGISDQTDNDPACDPAIADTTNASACVLSVSGTKVLKRIIGSDYPGVTIVSNTDEITFDPVRGTLSGGNGTIRILYAGFEFQVIVGTIGRTRICTETGSSAAKVGGYAECP